MKRIRYRHILLGSLVLLYAMIYGCKSYTPLYPVDRYMGLEWLDPTSAGIKKATEGGYILGVYKYDTIIGRQYFPYFKSTPKLDDKKGVPQDSLFLYFLDDVRFYYARKKSTSFDFTDKRSKKERIGWYSVVKEDGDTLLVLEMVKGRVDQPESFMYSQLELSIIEDGHQLKLIEATYPLYIQSRDKTQTRIPEKTTEFFKANKMGYQSNWFFEAIPLELQWDEKTIDHIEYDWQERVRIYYSNGQEVKRESLMADKRISY